SCGVEHARADCPLCHPHPQAAPAALARAPIAVRGEVACRTLFETAGVVLHASAYGGELRFVYHEGGAFRREDGSIIFRGDRDPRLRFRILGAATLVGRDGELAIFARGRPPEHVAIDAGVAPTFDTNGRRTYWTAGGRLFKAGDGALVDGHD